jgi:UPF0755 protein
MTNQQKMLSGAVVGCILALGMVTWLNKELAPTPAGKEQLVRWEAQSFDRAIGKLGEIGVVRNPGLFARVAKFRGQAFAVSGGTYSFRAGMRESEIFASLKTPLTQNVRIPEGWWIKRIAARLEEKNVCSADEYIELAESPEEFKGVVSFNLPKESLEGYLYPDTYELPPLLGARGVIERQLKTFESKVVKKLGNRDLSRALVVASMVELEAALDSERPRVAGVIENRIKRGMRLEIDATVLYALGEWKELGPGVVRTVQSPFNTYLNSGLPPGPIGSPGLKSIEAALKPESHGFLFYVARPDRSHYFTPSYDQHRAAINKARAEWKKGGV